MTNKIKIEMTTKQMAKFLDLFYAMRAIGKEENAPKSELNILNTMIDIFEEQKVNSFTTCEYHKVHGKPRNRRTDFCPYRCQVRRWGNKPSWGKGCQSAFLMEKQRRKNND